MHTDKMSHNKNIPSQPDTECSAEAEALAALTLNNWKGKKFARYLRSVEQDRLQQTSSQVAGYRLMHLGIASDTCELDVFKQLHQFYVRPPSEPLPEAHKGVRSSLEADYDQLPLPNGVVDVAVVQHALEYSLSPQGVLAETARVLAPGGHLILFVTNPVGPIGLSKRPMRLFSKRPEYNFSGLRKGRINDWLALLNFHIIQVADDAFALPFERLSNFKRDSFWERKCQSMKLPWGNFYMIHAVKRVTGGIVNKTRPWKATPSRGYASTSKKIKLKK